MIMDALSVQGLDTSPWRRVFFSFGFAAGVFVVTSVLMRQLLSVSPHAVDSDKAVDEDEEPAAEEEDRAADEEGEEAADE
jgi:hypothetical protein